jgi:protein involved in polysaccharide export with SLBB domain
VAGGLTSWAYDRELQVRHLDGSTDTVDLYAYKKLGDLSANPFLRGGDVIFVPGIDLNKPSVTVEGLVNDPGSYQIQPGETLKDVLLRVDALSRRTDLEGAYLERSENGETKRIPIFPYLRNMGNGHSQLLLQDGDVLKIGQRLEDVYVIGSVQYPGPYPYVPGLTVRDYIGFGGSMNQAASPKKTKLLRKGSQQEEVGLDVTVGTGDTIFVPKNAEFRVGEIASVLSALATTILVINQIATQ